MVQSNKILTVSYGTFSCTLEGFDDSFGTMKAIAEYFRDLAADDRYFGAEPPQPDADMLARIAQREISRRVDAHADGTGILLRAQAPAEAPVEAIAVTQAAPVDEAPVQEDVARDDPEVLVAEDVETPVLTPFKDTLADKLARIRAVVDRNEADDAQALSAHDLGADLPDEAVDLAEDAQDEAMFGAAAEAIDPEEDTLAAVNAALAQPDAPAESTAPDLQPAPEDLRAATDAVIVTEDAPADAPVVVEVSKDTTAKASEDAARDDVARDDATKDDANLFSSIDWDTDDEDDEADSDAIRNILSDLGPRSEAAIQAQANGPVTRVIKVKRADLEQAIAAGSFEEVASETPAAAPTEARAQPASSLSAQDEADLQAELDAVAAELAEAQAALNPPDEAPAAADRPREPIAEREPDVSRLMAEADSKMGEAENSSRREAYTHLRAAVAAAEAEETLSPETRKIALADAAYREDLASVVRPRRPEASGDASRPRRPGDSRPAPLKLVAEQRVDAETTQPESAPVRPRRVAAETEQDDEQPTGFVTFAQEVGARELHELLEAAAAYMSFVEGWEQFSRPQLMNRVKQVEKSGFNREDGLRTFGRLLREGKIQKTAGGRFTASEQIGFRPTHKAAG
ncbi:MAG: hypothetical protein CML66_01835 [Rhodobacteraceae bacterium]|nr:hypothetical protein [Paracoccaceae bacterium]